MVYRAGLADSRAQARQLVQHGHFTVNGRRVTIPSYLVRPGDVVSVREGSRKRTYFKNLNGVLDTARAPSWLSVDADSMVVRVVGMPHREDVDIPIDESLVVEYYSR